MSFKISAPHPAAALCAMICLALSCACAFPMERAELRIVTADGREIPVRAEVARTGAEQERGFMRRESIPDGTGMLFAFAHDRQLYFWMKDTPHPLSIAYIDSSGVIREIYDMVPFSLETIASVHSVRYALEVPAQWFTRAGIEAGDRLSAESLSLAAKGNGL